jgi:hypothetical protein
MRKTILWAAALAITAVLTSPAYAQPLSSDTAKNKAEGPTANQLTAIDDAHIARLKADLRLTSDQEGSWGKLESALKEISKRRADHFIARWTEERDLRKENRDQRPTPPTPIEQMRLTADGLSQHAADLKSVADAAEPLYGKLDDAQRRTLEASLREQLRPGGPEEARRRSAQW